MEFFTFPFTNYHTDKNDPFSQEEPSPSSLTSGQPLKYPLRNGSHTKLTCIYGLHDQNAAIFKDLKGIVIKDSFQQVHGEKNSIERSL